MIKELIKMANRLDSLGLKKETNAINDLIKFAASGESTRLAIKNNLKVSVGMKWANFSWYSDIAPGNMMSVRDGEGIMIKWKNQSSGAEENFTIDWNKISSAPNSGGLINLSDLSNKFSSVGLVAVIDESKRNKTLKDSYGYIYQIGWNGAYLKWSKDGKNWNILNQSYPKWSEVVKNINKIKA